MKPNDLVYLPVAGGDEAQVLRGALERYLRFAGRCVVPRGDGPPQWKGSAA